MYTTTRQGGNPQDRLAEALEQMHEQQGKAECLRRRRVELAAEIAAIDDELRRAATVPACPVGMIAGDGR